MQPSRLYTAQAEEITVTSTTLERASDSLVTIPCTPKFPQNTQTMQIYMDNLEKSKV